MGRNAIIVGATLALFLTPMATRAQTAGELAPPTFQPAPQRITGGLEISAPAVAKAPPGSEKLFVLIGDVSVENALPEMAGASARLRQALVGKTVSVADIFGAASELETAYANAGYVLSRVTLPPQTLRNGGTLKLVVVNGFVEKVDVSAAPAEVRGRLEILTSPLVGRDNATLGDIERSLLLAGDTYGVSLGSALSTGTRPGGTVITLDPAYKSVTGFVGIDNLVADDLGPVTLSGGVELNSLLQMGETFYGRAAGSPNDFFADNPQYRTLALGAVAPIGTNGLTLNIEGTASKTAPDDSIVSTTSSFDRISTRLFYPWIRSINLNISSQLILDVVEDEQFVLAGGGSTPVYSDQLSVARLSADLSWNSGTGGLFDATAVLSRGTSAFGAKRTPPAGAVPLSRQGADAIFSKLVLAAKYRQFLADQLLLSLNARYQTSFGDPLVASEQIGIAGTQELSAFDAGTLRGDSGWVVRGELAAPRDIRIGDRPNVFSPYLFAAYGSVSLKQPTVFERPTVNASSYGLGVDLISQRSSAFASASLRLEYGRGDRDDNRPDGDRFSIVGTYRF